MGARWIAGDFVFVSHAKAESLNANIARPGDIVFTQRGTVGQVSLVPEGEYERYLVSQSQMKLTVNRQVADPLFFYYVFSTAEQQDYVRQNAIQTGVPQPWVAPISSRKRRTFMRSTNTSRYVVRLPRVGEPTYTRFWRRQLGKRRSKASRPAAPE
jgi:hypothetical protein